MVVDRVVRLRLAANRVRLMRVTPREVNRLTTLQLPTWIDMIVQGFKALGNRLESSVLQGADRSTLSGLGSCIFLRAEVHRVTADDLAGLGHQQPIGHVAPKQCWALPASSAVNR